MIIFLLHVLGAARNETAYNTQRAVYTGWEKMHGVKMLSVVMPNRLEVMHGPISARRNDITSLQWSGLLQLLDQLQLGTLCIHVGSFLY